MIIFNNSNLPITTILSEANISERIFNIESLENAILDRDLINIMKDQLEVFLYHDDRAIIIMNNLSNAINNNKDTENEIINLKMFRALLQQYTAIGHKIAIYNDVPVPNADMIELAEIEGIDIVNGAPKLVSFLSE